MNGKWNVGAVLLDMDGTLLDTEKVYFESLVAALTAGGFADDAVTLCHAMVGLPGPACEAMLLDRYGADFPLADINRAFLANRDRLMEAGLPLKPGTLELLDALAAADCPMAIVTSSSRRSAERNLSLGGIRARFDTVLTLDDVTRGKPSPDLYLLAATRLGFPPQACIAVEDSNHGVAASHAAGAITIMVPDMTPPTEDTRAKCAAVLPDLNAVLAMLRERAGFGRRSS
ncbi:HAD family hydrolase [Bradyrhizobium sp. CCBAU 051011]|uniref:HAD family hydrolase n=1 Tax=Bradyrhizobium sp. CCBAU 051011 TaxID=858422 RepID=UPI0013742102|nr:HAD family phosphatase [Bradyrhizobium sp. CCBAU 051011]QHO71754.1 HAD family hydrolase [Bradyrhizobium sp. CCBAU 051011]